MLGLDIACLCTVFDHSSFSRFGDKIGAHRNLDGSRNRPRPFQGRFVIRGLALATINCLPNLKSLSPPTTKI